MSERKLKVVIPIGVLILGFIITMGLVKSRGPVATRPSREYTPLVRVIEVQPQSHRMSVTAHGTVRPRTETALVSEVAGQVVGFGVVSRCGFTRYGIGLLTLNQRVRGSSP